jgi:hypothetical protein
MNVYEVIAVVSDGQGIEVSTSHGLFSTFKKARKSLAALRSTVMAEKRNLTNDVKGYLGDAQGDTVYLYEIESKKRDEFYEVVSLSIVEREVL